jgi:CMP-N,N'-diacetyllegionaminic acid synthase
MTGMRVLGIVPARGGSKRVPRKNVRLLGGVPLVERALLAGLSSTQLAHVCVSSDDDEVLEIAARHKAATALRRPDALASDTAPAIAYVTHALDVLERDRGHARYDAVCILQPSSPLTLSSDVDATVSLLWSSGASSAVSVVEVAHDVHPVKLKRMHGQRLLPYLEDERGRMAAADLPTVFVRNCAVYVARRATVEQGAIVEDDCAGFVMPRGRSVDINDELDFLFCQFLFEQGGGSS